MVKDRIELTALRHPDARWNILTAELKTLMRPEDKSPPQVADERRHCDLDPQPV